MVSQKRKKSGSELSLSFLDRIKNDIEPLKNKEKTICGDDRNGNESSKRLKSNGYGNCFDSNDYDDKKPSFLKNIFKEFQKRNVHVQYVSRFAVGNRNDVIHDRLVRIPQEGRFRYLYNQKEERHAHSDRTMEGFHGDHNSEVMESMDVSKPMKKEPKKFLTALFWYMKENRESFKEKHPECYKNTDLVKRMADAWKHSVSEIEKKKYYTMQENDQMRYQEELQQWKKPSSI